MIKDLKINLKDQWKLINMRNVDDLLGVEFIHDLYNRHEPKINSIRFRHTITSWKDGVVKSYAPLSEWNKLGELLSMKFYNLDESTIYYTKKLYQRKREHYFRFIKSIKKTNLTLLSNQELLTLLLNFQSVVLGELYALNFVQVEHGLNLAIKKLLTEEFKDQTEVEKNFLNLIGTELNTKSQSEKFNFDLIVLKWRLLKIVNMYNDMSAKKDIFNHSEKFQYLYSAYGELPKSFNDYWSEFATKFNSKDKIETSFKLFNNILTKDAKKLLKKINNKKLTNLLPLLVYGGMFRDTNKALLGLSVKYRFKILDEITSRKIETRENLRFYLVADISDLLVENKKLDINTITERKDEGIVITRNEDFYIFKSSLIPLVGEETNANKLIGICASLGEVEGVCKIVLSRNDIHKVKEWDIMVAIGTDFDLIEAMYRSSAVLTEEGGILSHASVVCREINKPCIIGLKNCTSILHDGLRIKINAEKGEVLIIE